MRYAAMTVDVDRDINEPRAGAIEARCRGGGAPRYTSTARGLERLVRLFDDLGIKATFFWEGRAAEVLAPDLDVRGMMRGHEIAAHGYDHEDLTGGSTGVRPSEEWLDAIIGRSLMTLESVFGVLPDGFRCPYQHIDDRVARVLMQRGLRYDSTLFGDVGASIRPYQLEGELLEAPLAQGRDQDGKRLKSYLWPMHEGRREPDDYLHLATVHREGLLVLADHSWHIAESLDGQRGEDREEREIENVRRVLRGVMESGIEFVTVGEYLRLFSGDGE